ncbi:MAG: glycoside hydrolase family 1 protein [Xanthomonadaceae bacterium]|nr:glycoside hydrolase family 1 protein [Xanthomonadaceae bacterium]
MISTLLSPRYAIADFPKNFLWGAATAAHQVEGGNTQNDWYHWENSGGARDHSGLACDFWHRYSSDFDLARDLNMNAFRLSVEWSRIEPRPGEFDISVIETYRQILITARSKGLQTMVTLHHFTTPEWLASSGGWLSPAAIVRFKSFTDRVVLELGSEVDYWNTINEANVVALMGFVVGVSPPGLQDIKLGMRAYSNLIEAHAAAYRSIHAVFPNARVGIAHHMRVFEPARKNNIMDRTLARWVGNFWNKQFLEAIVTGEINLHIGPLFRVRKKVDGLKGSLDFLGINYYSRDKIRFKADEKVFFKIDTVPTGTPQNDLGWEIYPQGLVRVVNSVKKYGWPIYITENGAADRDDVVRPKFICDHLMALESSIESGADVRGYFHWSLSDNFEWSLGFAPRFGLYAMNYETQERTLRPSGQLYGEIARAGSARAVCGRSN